MNIESFKIWKLKFNVFTLTSQIIETEIVKAQTVNEALSFYSEHKLLNLISIKRIKNKVFYKP